jgi:hypothetical protein
LADLRKVSLTIFKSVLALRDAPHMVTGPMTAVKFVAVPPTVFKVAPSACDAYTDVCPEATGQTLVQPLEKGGGGSRVDATQLWNEAISTASSQPNSSLSKTWIVRGILHH